MPGIGSALNWGNQQTDLMRQATMKPFDDNTNMGLYDNWESIAKLLQPYFDKQRGNLQRQQTTALGDASRFGGSYAAAHGYDNPYSFQENSRNKVYGSFAPQFGELETNQLGSLLNSTSQNNQFKNTNFWNRQNYGLQERGLNLQEDAQGFDFFRDLLPGLLGAGGSIIGAGIGRKENPWF